MSRVSATATKFTCDNKGCGLTRLTTGEAPTGWVLVTLGSMTDYCSRECAGQALRLAVVEQRDTSGWIATSVPVLLDPMPTELASPPWRAAKSESPDPA